MIRIIKNKFCLILRYIQFHFWKGPLTSQFRPNYSFNFQEITSRITLKHIISYLNVSPDSSESYPIFWKVCEIFHDKNMNYSYFANKQSRSSSISQSLYILETKHCIPKKWIVGKNENW